ncbi:mitochondrial assembly of ribosomal large subunit protein 1-like [Ctenocephalides felis]|uniref:mitochondrial assembly of ribosomal large subunit protein 1-like n=1 Tax=Ctenocephalides felis TaxID=7515 RepID=UPI000E6E15EC|nr:mitochondrial assembly of ribosomal large subunit protein 1-like [Ctenocephalides felis]
MYRFLYYCAQKIQLKNNFLSKLSNEINFAQVNYKQFCSRSSDYNISKELKYEKFEDKISPQIFDIEEERRRKEMEEHEDDKELHDITNNVLKRGVSGVFDIDELVEVIRLNKGQDLCVIAVPKSMKYIDYMCSVTCRNTKHMLGIAEFIRKIYKKKRSKDDPIPKIEGANSKEWIALDLGNIAVHLFLKKVRQKYDIDMLWSVGPEYDTETNKPEETITELLQSHSEFLDKLIPKEQ